MANRTSNVDLRVSARTEGLNNLKQVGEALDRLEQQQGEFARSAGTAGKSFGELERELRNIDRTADRLRNIDRATEAFREQRRIVGQSAQTIRRTRDELKAYAATLPSVRKRTDEQRAAIKAYEKTIRDAEAAQAKARKAAAGYAEQLRSVGVVGGDARRELARLNDVVARQQTQARTNIDDFPRRLERQREITEEAQRRIALEQNAARQLAQQEQQRQNALAQRQARLEQALSVFRPELARREQREREDSERRVTAELRRQRDVVRDRIAAERQISSGFAAFSRAAAGAPARARAAETTLAARQTAQRDADLAARQARIRALSEEQQAQQRAAALEQRIQERLAGRPGLLGRVTRATQQSAAANRQAASGLGQIEQALRRTAGQGRTTLDFFQRLRGQVLELAATYGSLFSAITLVQQAIQNDIARTGVENRLLFANQNDAKQTASDLAFVRDVADDLGQSFSNLATLYSRFTVASSAANVSVETTRNTFRGLAESFTVLGLSQDDVAGSFRAIEQSISKGTVQAEELRGQLGDRFPGAATTFARAIGVSVQELNKLLEAGRVSSSAWEFFSEEVARQARSVLPRATNDLRASLQRFSTAWEDFTILISRSGLGEEIGKLARELTAFFKSDDGVLFARGLSDAFSLVVTALRGLLTVIDPLILGLQAFLGILAGRVLAAAIAGLIAGVKALIPLFLALRGVFVGTAAASAAAAGGLRAVGVAAAGALGPLTLLAGVAAVFFADYALGAADAARQTAEFEKEMEALGNVTGETATKIIDTRTELIALNRSRLEGLRAEIKAFEGEVEEARKRVEELQAQVGPDGLNAGFLDIPRLILARRELAKKEEKLAQDNRQARRREAADIEEFNKNLQDAVALRNGIFEDGAEILARGNSEANQKLLRENDQFYNEYATDAQAFADRVQSILNVDALRPGSVVTPAQRIGLENLLNQINSARREAREVIRPTGTNDAAARRAQADADRRAREIEQLQEESNRERERSLRESLQRLTEDEATAAEARVELIKLEYAQKIAEQQKFAAEAQRLNQTALVAQFQANVGALEGERDQVIATEQRNTAVANLRAEYERLNTTLERSISERNAKVTAINEAEQAGIIGTEVARQRAYETNLEYQERIAAEIDALVAFLEANRENVDLNKLLNVEETLINLQGTKAALVGLSPAQQEGVRLAREFTSGLTQSFTAFGAGIANAIKSVASFGDAFKAAADSFREFLADFLIGIGQAIVQAALFRSLFGDDGTGGLLGGFLGGVGRLIVPGRHRGGVVGYSAPTFTRSVPAAIFDNAVRYHSGGIAGLKPDEVPTILQTGEEVLSRSDPRNRLNGGAAGGGANVQIVNAIDAESVVAAGLQGNAGRQIITNIIQANKASFRQILAS